MAYLEEETHNYPRWNLWTYEENIPYLARFLSNLLAGIGRTERRIAVTRYIEGLLLPARRKLIRPMAERLNVDPQSMQQAITHARWDDQQMWSAIRQQVIPLLGPLDFWIVNERAWEKQGGFTVGVSNQRCGTNGKKSHCQVSLELLASNGSIAAPVASRLYLPEDWAGDGARRKRAVIPENVSFSTKPALAIELLNEAYRGGVSPGIVFADRSYGESSEFRSALLHLGLEFFLEVDPAANSALDPDKDSPHWDASLQPSRVLDTMFGKNCNAEWTHCSWVLPDGIFRHTRIAIREVLLKPGRFDGKLERLWLVVDWPTDEPKPFRCYLCSCHRRPTKMQCLRYSRFRSYAEHYRSYFEKTLDLGCYQGRLWNGFHHHLVLAALAYLFVLRVEQRSRCPFWADLMDDAPIDAAIATETARFFSVLRRNGAKKPDPVEERGKPVPAV
jgi:SRSO17 transposase